MRDPLLGDVLGRLLNDYGFERAQDYLRKGKCPACGKRELFTDARSPWRVQCGRLNKCGESWHIKELYPDLFESWTERYGNGGRPVYPNGKPVSPTAIADAYLSIGRGFNLEKIKGWYSQETYWDNAAGIGSATVRFQLPGGGHWERLIDKPQRFGKRKAGVSPGTKYAGLWWSPPGIDLATAPEIWIAEGIFDAIALIHAGVVAVSSVSCSNYPERALLALADDCGKRGIKRPALIWAYDGDEAGLRYTRKAKERSKRDDWRANAALIPLLPGRPRRDWNDAWQRGELSRKHLDDYRQHGAILTAESVGEKAFLLYEKNQQRSFWFEYKERLYWHEVDEKKLEDSFASFEQGEGSLRESREKAVKNARSIHQIANCYPRPLYYMANAVTDEAWYFWQVGYPHDHKRPKGTFTGAQLSSPTEFRKRLLHIAPGALFDGKAEQLQRILNDTISRIMTVETIDYIGYSREHECWLWGDICVRDGKAHEVNAEDYFDFGRLRLKTLAQSPTLHVNADRGEYNADWTRHLWAAFGARGLVALGFWLGSLFAEQMRDRHKSWPFLELVGEAGSGKSTLIEFLWKLCGRRDYEGFDPVKATLSARARNFAQVANLPVVLIESDREEESPHKQKSFDWDELKTAYNGRSVRARGMRTSGNDTYEPPFRGAIVISQNAAVNASEAILQRIVHIEFTRATHTDLSKKAAERLEQMPIEQVSQFALFACEKAATLLPRFDEYFRAWEAAFQADREVRVHRLAKNHGQLAAWCELLGPAGLDLFPQSAIDEATAEVHRMARERQQAIGADHPIVAEFWDAYDYAEGHGAEGTRLNHAAKDSGLIAINLRHMESVCAMLRIQIPDPATLKRYLKGSRSRRFIDSNRAVHSQLTNKSTRAWVFKAPS